MHSAQVIAIASNLHKFRKDTNPKTICNDGKKWETETLYTMATGIEMVVLNLGFRCSICGGCIRIRIFSYMWSLLYIGF